MRIFVNILLIFSSLFSITIEFDTTKVPINSPQVQFIDKIVKDGDATAITILKKKNYIELDSVNDSTVIIKPEPAVRDIIIHGAYPLFNSEIEKVMTIRSGDPLTDDIIEEQKKIILKKILSNGLINSTVNIKLEKVKKNPGLVNVVVDIDHNQYRKVKKVTFVGDTMFSAYQRYFAFNVSHYKRFNIFPLKYTTEELKDDSRALRNYYRARGYSKTKVNVRDSLLSLDKDSNEYIELKVNIELDTAEKIEFGDIYPLKKRDIKSDFDIKYKGNLQNSTVNSAINSMKKKLFLLGYTDSKVIVKDTNLVKGKRYPHIVKERIISVEPNQRIKIEQLKIIGNKLIPLDTLKTVMNSKVAKLKKRSSAGVYNKEIFEKDIEQLKNLYINNGFFHAVIKSNVKIDSLNRAKINIKIKEGKPTIISNITMDKSLLDTIEIPNEIDVKEGDRYNFFRVVAEKNYIKESLQKEGYVFANVVVNDSFNNDSSRVDIDIKITPNKKLYIHSILFWGNFKTDEEFLKKIIDVKEGELFLPQKINESIKELRDLNLFEFVNYTRVNRDDDSVDIVFILNEKKSITVKGAVGYESEKKFYLTSSFIKNNLWGRNKAIEVQGGYSEIEYGGKAIFTDYNFVNTNIKAAISVYGNLETPLNASYETQKIGNSYSIGYDFTKKITLSFVGSYLAKKSVAISTDYISSQDSYSNDMRHTLTFEPKFNFDGRNSFVKPTKGFVFNSNSVVSKGINVDIDDYWTSSIEGKFYFAPFRKVVIASRIRNRTIRPYGENSVVPEDERYFLGGTNSVRGYSENMLFNRDGKAEAGDISIDGSIEIRPEVIKFLEIPLFWDFGTLSFDSSFSHLEPLKSSIGTGLRYISPIGPIGIVYGLKLNKSENESPGTFHFSIGYTF